MDYAEKCAAAAQQMDQHHRSDAPQATCNQAMASGLNHANSSFDPMAALEALGHRYASHTEEHRTIESAVLAYWGMREQVAVLTARAARAEGELSHVSHKIELAQTALA